MANILHKSVLVGLLMAVAAPCFAQDAARFDTFADSLRTELQERGMPSKILFLPYVLSGRVFEDARAGLWSLSALDAVACASPDAAGGKDVRLDNAHATSIALSRLDGLHEALGSWDRAVVAFAEGPAAGAVPSDAEISHSPVLSALDEAAGRFSARPGEAFAAVPDRLLRRDRERSALQAAEAAARSARVDTLRKRASAAVAAASPTIVYKVRRGDTLGAIALRYKVRVSDLKKWNNLRGDMIREGQKLVIHNSTAR